MKRSLKRIFSVIAFPLKVVGRLFLRCVGVPLYRFFFSFKRFTTRVFPPARRRLLFFVSNKYAIHFAVVLITGVTSVLNIGTSSVRAESFGKDSILYGLVAKDDASELETVTAKDIDLLSNADAVIDPFADMYAHVDLAVDGIGYATTAVGGSAITSPALMEESVPKSPKSSRSIIETYVIAEKDTLAQIADQFDLNLSTILWANNLTFRSVIRPGQTLKILPIDGVLYQIKKGDTVGKIAQKFKVDAEKITAFNHLSETSLQLGAEIIIPDGEPLVQAVVTKKPAAIRDIFSSPPADASRPASRGSASGLGNWVWPTDWRVITQPFGWKHTGVDIDGDFKTFSYAANDGVVIYSGWRNGYGYTVELRHEDGIVTRYAHHSKLFVKVGDVVKAGDRLAQTGTTGHSTGTHLHFEVIKDKKFQNPLNYIR